MVVTMLADPVLGWWTDWYLITQNSPDVLSPHPLLIVHHFLPADQLDLVHHSPHPELLINQTIRL